MYIQLESNVMIPEFHHPDFRGENILKQASGRNLRRLFVDVTQIISVVSFKVQTIEFQRHWRFTFYRSEVEETGKRLSI